MKKRLVSGNPYLPQWEHIPDGEPRVFTYRGETRVYVYGSHDTEVTDYCGRDYVVWSAPAEDLTDWTCHGTCYTASDGSELYAPDVVCRDGIYYMYAAEQRGSKVMVARSESPTGPFTDPILTELGFDPGVLVDDDGRVYAFWGFCESHACELNDDMATIRPGTHIEHLLGHAGAPWIHEKEHADTHDGFYEASSPRKVLGRYVLIYSKKYEYPLPQYGIHHDNNGFLSYKWSENPLGPYHDGGDISFNGGELIRRPWGTAASCKADEQAGTDRKANEQATSDGKADEQASSDGEANEQASSDGKADEQATSDGKADEHASSDAKTNAPERIMTYQWGNNHGSIAEICGKWYVFYHRQTGVNEFSRQGMLEPVDTAIDQNGQIYIGKITYENGNPVSSYPVEMTSQGPYIDGLDAYSIIPAACACHIYDGSGEDIYSDCDFSRSASIGRAHVLPVYTPDSHADKGASSKGHRLYRGGEAVYAPVTDIVNNTTVGFRYLNFGDLSAKTVTVTIGKLKGCSTDDSCNVLVRADSYDGAVAAELNVTFRGEGCGGDDNPAFHLEGCGGDDNPAFHLDGCGGDENPAFHGEGCGGQDNPAFHLDGCGGQEGDTCSYAKFSAPLLMELTGRHAVYFEFRTADPGTVVEFAEFTFDR